MKVLFTLSGSKLSLTNFKSSFAPGSNFLKLFLLIFLQYCQIFSKSAAFSDLFMFLKDGSILTKKPYRSLQIFLYATSVSKHLDLLSAENTPMKKRKDRQLFCQYFRINHVHMQKSIIPHLVLQTRLVTITYSHTSPKSTMAVMKPTITFPVCPSECLSVLHLVLAETELYTKSRTASK